MTNPLKLRIFPLLLLPLLTCTAFGEKPKNHTFRILFLERPSTAPQTLQLFDGTGSQEVELPNMNFSRVYELPAATLALALLPQPIDDPEKLPPGAPTAMLPEGVIDFYLLVSSDPANKIAPVRMQIINAPADRLRPGQTLWLNLTDLTIGGRLGSEKLLIKPRSRATTNPPVNKAGAYPVSLAYRVAGNDLTYPICETKWTHNPLTRTLAFVIAREGVRTPAVLLFPDFREPLEPEP
jgi:hypothetical protein